MHLKEAFKQEINKVLQAGVLAPVNEATPWINSFFLFESKDKLGNLKLHFCLDVTNLNKAITREPYLSRFRYNVISFGITVTGDVFQQKLDQCFGKIDQMIVIADDIMIVAEKQNHKDHDIALTTLLETARKCNVKLNYEKLQYKKTGVDFFAETYTTDGHKSAQSKVSAIVDMPAPTCKK